MYVSNRFNIGDEVYFINPQNKPCKAKVEHIYIHVKDDTSVPFPEPDITYILDVPDGEEYCYEEGQLYLSEYELRDAWMKDLIEFV